MLDKNKLGISICCVVLNTFSRKEGFWDEFEAAIVDFPEVVKY